MKRRFRLALTVCLVGGVGMHADSAAAANTKRKTKPRITAAYRRMRSAWHRPPPAALRERWQEHANPPLVLRPVHHAQPFVLLPDSEGNFDVEQAALAQQALGPDQDNPAPAVDSRLLWIVYQAVRHFKAPYVHVVSGYRGSAAEGSRHRYGEAIDMVLPGVTDRRLAAFLRRQSGVGVGLYPVSGFVHLDVREASYFWVDASAPGQRSRPRTLKRRPRNGRSRR